MKIKISWIWGKNQINEERIWLKIISDCNLKHYQLFATKFTESWWFVNRSNSTYWFTPEEIKAWDEVVVYTKKGKDNIKKNDDGTRIFFLYWWLKEPIFKNDKSWVVLAQIENWSSSINM
jgi:hypothetical protein